MNKASTKHTLKMYLCPTVFPNVLKQRADRPNPVLSIVMCNGYRLQTSISWFYFSNGKLVYTWQSNIEL